MTDKVLREVQGKLLILDWPKYDPDTGLVVDRPSPVQPPPTSAPPPSPPYVVHVKPWSEGLEPLTAQNTATLWPTTSRAPPCGRLADEKAQLLAGKDD